MYRIVSKYILPKLDVSHINAQNTPTLAEKKAPSKRNQLLYMHENNT